MNLESFPYHGLMLFLLAPFALLGEIIGMGEILIKIPLLISDVGILFVLLKLFPHKEKNIYMYYFLNPIILYSTYIHSQLDIIPTALLFASVYFLALQRLKISALFLGFALATKFHVIIALPLILFYLYRKFYFKSILTYLIISILVFITFDLPFIFSDGFIHMVLFNPKQSLLFDTFYLIGSVKILLPVAAICMVYFHFFNQNKVNDDLLFFYFGLLFTATIFFIYPGPAWYVWMIPFVTIYFIQNQNQSKTLILYGAFSFTYLLFFIFFYKSEYQDMLFLGKVIDFKIHNENLQNLSFTLLEVTLLAIMYAFYKHGIKSNSIYKKQTNLTIGIGGDSGVGKSTLIKNLENILGDKLIQLEGDGEHKWERGDENWSNFTHLDPKANHIHKQAESILRLKNNQETYRNEYDHSTGKFTEAFKITPKEFIVIAGLHPFYLPKLRKNIDLKVYIDTDETLRRHWKIIRDTKKRGYSVEKIIEQIETRVEDARKYIYPQKEFADLVIKYFSLEEFKLGDKSEIINLGLKITLDANIHIEDVLERLDVKADWDYNEDLQSQYLILKDIPKVGFEDIAIDTIENITEIIPSGIIWSSGYDGLLELISLKMISEKLKEENR
ncbi:uridine kinase [Poseidonibacter ostreae]|nr:uridine kinase [Poseidonibacter ostreae]